ncbi:PH domain-containing protein [Cellulomonas sp. PhB150]|uniref:PH domain-containing protein n=1 Tax=Cellulomonas sp. PhB150 TaxID=2485188 RepID=UPI000F953E6C|nr:PH domain-containing protein [Cellulomonas sp. PhB150]ROS30652.1 PH (Pleckstrin Homology) domain-containing protein [Cellulomonas sp. PhB150]
MPALTAVTLDELYAPFRPRLARIVTLVMAVVVVLGTVVVIVSIPELGPADQIGFALLCLLIVWFCWRQFSVAATPSADGLVVRNLMITTRLAWAEVVSVRFGSGRPWVQLDLADGDTLAVMGVQRADGERAVAEARRMATLVAQHTATQRDD